METHISVLERLCRVCGNQLKALRGKRPAKRCTSHALDIRDVYGIDISRDSSGIHPDKFCTYCYRRILHTKRRKDSTSYIVNDASHIEQLWEPHTDTCLICIHASGLGKGFGVRKRDPIRFERVPLLYNPQSSDLFYSV